MKKIRVNFSILIVSLLLGSGGTAIAGDSLYDRIGGYNVIAKFSIGLIDGFYADPRLVRFNEGGAPVAVVERDKQLTAEYMCKITGGPCFYIGKDMLETHKDLKITQAEWDALLDIARDVTAGLKLTPNDKQEFLTLFDDMEGLMNIDKP